MEIISSFGLIVSVSCFPCQSVFLAFLFGYWKKNLGCTFVNSETGGPTCNFMAAKSKVVQ
jgi:hypothetical protein